MVSGERPECHEAPEAADAGRFVPSQAGPDSPPMSSATASAWRARPTNCAWLAWVRERGAASRAGGTLGIWADSVTAVIPIQDGRGRAEPSPAAAAATRLVSVAARTGWGHDERMARLAGVVGESQVVER